MPKPTDVAALPKGSVVWAVCLGNAAAYVVRGVLGNRVPDGYYERPAYVVTLSTQVAPLYLCSRYHRLLHTTRAEARREAKALNLLAAAQLVSNNGTDSDHAAWCVAVRLIAKWQHRSRKEQL